MAWFLGCALAVAFAPGRAGGIVDIALNDQYFSEPAKVRLTISVEPAQENRMLRIEAEGDELLQGRD
jgi:hypothetical protein